jgi:hypothetical protein
VICLSCLLFRNERKNKIQFIGMRKRKETA